MNITAAKYFGVGMTVAGALCVAAMLVFLTLPTLQDAHALAGNLTDAETAVQAQYANRKQLSETLDRFKAAKATMTDLASQFVAPGDELTFIKSIEKIGETNGVEVHLLLSTGGAIPDVKEFDHGFSLTLNGSFPAVLHALVDLERLTQLTVIQSVNIQGGSAGPDQAVPIAVSLNGLFASPPKGL